MADNTVQNAQDNIATDELNMVNGITQSTPLPKAVRSKTGYGEDGIFVDVTDQAPLPVNIASSLGNASITSGNLTAVASTVAMDVSKMGNGTIVLFGGTYTSLKIVFEATVDGSNYFPIDVTRADGSGTVQFEQYAATGVRAWNYTSPGYIEVRVRATSYTATVAPSIYITAGPLLVDWSPSVPPVDGIRPTYVAAISNLSNTAASDLFYVTGSATKTVRVSRIDVSATGSSAVGVNIVATKYTGRTGGTTSAATVGPLDSGDVAATATASGLTASSTGGTVQAIIRTQKMYVPTTTTAGGLCTWDFGGRPAKAPVLRGTAERLYIATSAAVATGSWSIAIEFTEE